MSLPIGSTRQHGGGDLDALRFYRSLGFREHELVLSRDLLDAP
jgi:hypothetical protein